MSVIGQGISLRGMIHNDFHYPFMISGTVTAADLGKPVTLDKTAANTVKIAGDGDTILGQLVTYEDRKVEGVKVATVALRGGWAFKVKSGDALAIGDTAVGAGAGEIKKATANDLNQNVVVEISGGVATVIR